MQATGQNLWAHLRYPISKIKYSNAGIINIWDEVPPVACSLLGTSFLTEAALRFLLAMAL